MTATELYKENMTQEERQAWSRQFLLEDELAKDHFAVLHLSRGEKRGRISIPAKWRPLSCAIQYLRLQAQKALQEGWTIEAMNIGKNDVPGDDYGYVKVGEWTLSVR
jgi:hypothetical protein